MSQRIIRRCASPLWGRPDGRLATVTSPMKGGLARSSGGELESRLWVAVVERDKGQPEWFDQTKKLAAGADFRNVRRNRRLLVRYDEIRSGLLL
jgi:hypothetical protein